MTVYDCDNTVTPQPRGAAVLPPHNPPTPNEKVLRSFSKSGSPIPNPEHNCSDPPQIDPWDAGYYNVSDNPAR